jgi:hypothetical protein
VKQHPKSKASEGGSSAEREQETKPRVRLHYPPPRASFTSATLLLSPPSSTPVAPSSRALHFVMSVLTIFFPNCCWFAGVERAPLQGVISPEEAGAMSGVRGPEASPGRYVRRRDEIDDPCDDVLGVGAGGAAAGPFDIPAKRAPVQRLRRWRVSTAPHSRPRFGIHCTACPPLRCLPTQCRSNLVRLFFLLISCWDFGFSDARRSAVLIW